MKIKCNKLNTRLLHYSQVSVTHNRFSDYSWKFHQADMILVVSEQILGVMYAKNRFFNSIHFAT